MGSINKSSTIKINENISSELIDDNYFLLNIDDGEFYELNLSSSLIWKCIMENNKIIADDLVSMIANIFNTKRSMVEKDIYDFLNDALKKNLIKT